MAFGKIGEKDHWKHLSHNLETKKFLPVQNLMNNHVRESQFYLTKMQIAIRHSPHAMSLLFRVMATYSILSSKKLN